MFAHATLSSSASGGGLTGGQFEFADNSTANLSIYSFACPFGEAQANRAIIVSISARGSNNVANVTIGGVAAIEAHSGSKSNSRASIWIANVPSLSSGDVVVAFSGSVESCSIALYSFYGLSSTTKDSVATATSTGSTSITPSAGGCIIGTCNAGTSASSVTISWSGSTPDSTVAPDSAPAQHTSSFGEPGGATTITAGGSLGGAGSRVWIAAAFS